MKCCSTFLIWLGFLLPLAAQNEAVRGFITVEPFELRIGALCKPGAFADSWKLSEPVIQGSKKEQILATSLEMLKQYTLLGCPDQKLVFDSAQTHFIKEVKDLGYVPDDRDEIPLSEALVGVSVSSLCNNVGVLEIQWNWFAPGQNRVPVEVSAGKSSMARYLTPEESFMRWTRSGETDSTPKLLSVPAIRKVPRSHQPILLYAGLGILGLAGLVVLIRKTKTPPLLFFMIPLGLVALVGAFRFAESVPELPDSEEAGDLVYTLLRNTYHAFDFRDESEIYDTLEKSIAENPLLEEVYLAVRKGLELEIRGGPRVRIKGIDLRDCSVIARNDDAGTFDVQSEWVAIGDVNHWGHSHLRTNRYQANLRIGTVDDTWKIKKMQIIEEERTQQVTKTDRPIQ